MIYGLSITLFDSRIYSGTSLHICLLRFDTIYNNKTINIYMGQYSKFF